MPSQTVSRLESVQTSSPVLRGERAAQAAAEAGRCSTTENNTSRGAAWPSQYMFLTKIAFFQNLPKFLQNVYQKFGRLALGCIEADVCK